MNVTLCRVDESIGGNDWRQIKCRDVQWASVPGVSVRVTYSLYRQCSSHEHDTENEAERKWAFLTLGELADRGERRWHQDLQNAGPVTIEAIKLAIDYAAAGYEITRMPDAYVPRPVKGNVS